MSSQSTAMRSPKCGEARRRSTRLPIADCRLPIGEYSRRNASTSAGDGGRPVRSKLKRRRSVAGSASGWSLSLRAARAGETRVSRGCAGSTDAFVREAATADVGVRAPSVSGTNAQCASYCAPSAIQRRSRTTSAVVRLGSLAFAGGMWSSASFVVTRRSSSLLSGLPGTMALFFSAPSRVSRRRPDSRFFSSGPWQKKHLSERMGRMSRL